MDTTHSQKKRKIESVVIADSTNLSETLRLRLTNEANIFAALASKENNDPLRKQYLLTANELNRLAGMYSGPFQFGNLISNIQELVISFVDFGTLLDLKNTNKQIHDLVLSKFVALKLSLTFRKQYSGQLASSLVKEKCAEYFNGPSYIQKLIVISSELPQLLIDSPAKLLQKIATTKEWTSLQLKANAAVPFKSLQHLPSSLTELKTSVKSEDPPKKRFVLPFARNLKKLQIRAWIYTDPGWSKYLSTLENLVELNVTFLFNMEKLTSVQKLHLNFYAGEESGSLRFPPNLLELTLTGYITRTRTISEIDTREVQSLRSLRFKHFEMTAPNYIVPTQVTRLEIITDEKEEACLDPEIGSENIYVLDRGRTLTMLKLNEGCRRLTYFCPAISSYTSPDCFTDAFPSTLEEITFVTSRKKPIPDDTLKFMRQRFPRLQIVQVYEDG